MRISLALLVLLVACRPSPTQTWVFVHLDPAFDVEAEALRLVVTSRGEEIVSRVDAIDRTREVVANLYLIPEGGDATRTWEIHATLLRDGDAVAELRVGGGYASGEVRVVHAHFDTADACIALGDCGPGRTCQSGRCVGACFETVAETDQSTRQLARCGECASCADGACVPAVNGTECGCAGDMCRDGECDPEVEVLQVWAGQSHACAQTNRGLWCWGSGRTRQTTFREATDRPRRVEAPEVRNISDMVLGDEFSCGIWIRSGPVYGETCWGWATHGGFAMGELSGVQDPTEALDIEDALVEIEGGRFFQCGLRESGRVQCAGNNDSNQLALPDAVDGSSEWVDIPGQYDELAASGSAVCARNPEGVWCWGLSTIDGSVRSPDLMCLEDAEGGCVDTLRIVEIADGRGCGLDTEGRAYCWGSNRGGLLGVEGPERVSSPTAIDSELRFSKLALDSSVCGVDYDAMLHCWGEGAGGQLGTGDRRDRTRPTPVRVDAGERWTDVTLGRGFACAIRDDRQLYCWGPNSGNGPGGSRFAGRLGLGLGTDPSDPAAQAVVSRPMRVCFEDPPE